MSILASRACTLHFCRPSWFLQHQAGAWVCNDPVILPWPWLRFHNQVAPIMQPQGNGGWHGKQPAEARYTILAMCSILPPGPEQIVPMCKWLTSISACSFGTVNLQIKDGCCSLGTTQNFDAGPGQQQSLHRCLAGGHSRISWWWLSSPLDW